MKPALLMMLKSDPDIREAVAEIARGAVLVPSAAPVPAEANPDEEIAQAIRDLAGIEGAFGQDGKPKVKAIEQAMGAGADISAADRDRVWAAMQEADAA